MNITYKKYLENMKIQKWEKFNESSSTNFRQEIYSIAKEEYGGSERSDVPGYEIMVDTTYGPLFINVRDDIGHTKDSVYAIFMRFAFPQDAKGQVDCNQNSGKWNIWYSNYDDSVSEFKRRMEEVKGQSENPFDRLENELY